MSAFSAAQTLRPAAQDARLSARAGFTVAHVLPAPTLAAVLEIERVPGAHFTVEQTEAPPTQRPRLVLATWRGPAEPRPPGVPAEPRPV